MTMTALTGPALSVGPECAAALDASDPMRAFREEFCVDDGVSYLCGNCLGLQPRAARRRMDEVMAGWSELGFRAHFTAPHHWMTYEQDSLSELMAELVGARPNEVAVMNSLSVNLHLMLASFLRPSGERRKVLVEDAAFPSDRFVVESHLRLRGYDPSDVIVVAPSGPLGSGAEQIESAIDAHAGELCLVLLSTPNFRTGRALDIERIATAARRAGCLIGFDLAHAVGNLELDLHRWGVDFAVWCTYKYLNAGPGSVGACFVHERHTQPAGGNRLEGWWGNRVASRFDMSGERPFEPADGAGAWQISSPPILSMAALRASLEIFSRAKMQAIRNKSVKLGDYLIYLVDRRLSDHFTLVTPRDPSQRGNQITLRVSEGARALQSALVEAGVICDVKGEDIVRVTPSPLYNTFNDIHRFVAATESYLERRGRRRT